MFCPNCGTQNPDSSKYCTSCGTALSATGTKPESSDDQKKIQLRCKACGGSLDIVNGQNVLLCPFCGSKELIKESDAVTIQRIKSNTTKDLVFGVMDRAQSSKQQRVEEQRRKEAEQRERTRKMLPILGIVIAVIIIFCIIMASVSGGNSLNEPIQTGQKYVSFSPAEPSGASSLSLPWSELELVIHSLQ